MEDEEMIRVMVDGVHTASVSNIKEAQDLRNYFLYNGTYPLFPDVATVYNPETKETYLSCFSYEAVARFKEYCNKKDCMYIP
jgi:hypothetical protein